VCERVCDRESVLRAQKMGYVWRRDREVGKVGEWGGGRGREERREETEDR
jgi:hypothetical protein